MVKTVRTKIPGRKLFYPILDTFFQKHIFDINDIRSTTTLPHLLAQHLNRHLLNLLARSHAHGRSPQYLL